VNTRGGEAGGRVYGVRIEVGNDRSISALCFLQDSFVGHFAVVGALDLYRDTNEGASNGISRGRSQHLVPDLGAIGRPMIKDDLVAQSALLLLELQVVHGPTTLGFGQIAEEFIVVFRCRLLVLDYLRLVVADSEDDVLPLLLEFQLLKQCQAL